MATTCKQIIEAAYARRTANDPDRLATKAELVALIDRLVKAVYARVGKVNRRYFGATADVVGDGTKWARPSDATAVLWVESAGPAGSGSNANLTPGARVHITPFSDRDAEMSPKIYPFGSFYFSAGGAEDPDPTADGDKLRFYYAQRHPDLDPMQEPDAAANTLSASWPEHYNDLLVSRVARYLATKDGRGSDEIAHLNAEYEELLALLLDEVKQDNDRISQRWPTE